MNMQVQKKFTMLSTKEWMQYFQYKLPSEREKEMLEEAEYDSFLKEALESFESLEGRHLVYQSLGYIHGQIQEYTGVSESKIENNQKNTTINLDGISKKTILIGLSIFLLLCLILGSIWAIKYYNINLFESTEATSTDTLEEVSVPTQTIDSSQMPFDTLSVSNIPPQTTPNVPTAAINPTSPTVNNPNISKKTSPNNISSAISNPTNPNQSATSLSSAISNANSNDRAQFEKAQELYKNNKIEESRAILKKLNSYENNYKNQAGTILQSIGN